jgi:hypothetical protein
LSSQKESNILNPPPLAKKAHKVLLERVAMRHDEVFFWLVLLVLAQQQASVSDALLLRAHTHKHTNDTAFFGMCMQNKTKKRHACHCRPQAMPAPSFAAAVSGMRLRMQHAPYHMRDDGVGDGRVKRVRGGCAAAAAAARLLLVLL